MLLNLGVRIIVHYAMLYKYGKRRRDFIGRFHLSLILYVLMKNSFTNNELEIFNTALGGLVRY